MDDEQKEYLTLTSNEFTEEMRGRSGRLINLIRYKLAASSPSNLWQFNLGIITAGIVRNATRTGGDADLRSYLRDLAAALKTAPLTFAASRLRELSEVARYSEKGELTHVDKDKLFRLLEASRDSVIREGIK